MSNPIGVFSFGTLEAFMRLGQRPAVVVKRAAILFDKLVFHPQGTHIDMPFPLGTSRQEFFARILAADKAEQSFLNRDNSFRDMFILTDDLTDDAEVVYRSISDAASENRERRIASHAVASEAIMETLKIDAPEKDYSNWYESMKRLPYGLAEDFAVFDTVNSIIPSSTGLFSELHGRVAAAALDEVPKSAHSIDLIREIDDLKIADFSELPWERILELRSDGLLSDFRLRLAQAAEEQQKGQPARAASLLQDLWALMREVEPQLGKTYMSAILGNIPVPFLFNPISVAGALNDVEKAHRLRKEYGWLFFVSKAQRL